MVVQWSGHRRSAGWHGDLRRPTDRSSDLVVEVDGRPDADTLRGWDRLVSATPGSDVAQLSAWAVVRRDAGFSPCYILARSGDTLLVIQPEEIGHGRSIVIVAGGSVTRPGLAYRQVERAAATLMSA